MVLNGKIMGAICRLIEEGFDRDQAILPDKLSPEEKNILRGGGIIMMFSWTQYRCPNDIWSNRYNDCKPFQWDHWNEFINFNYTRNCFAHSGDGMMMSPDYHRRDIERFLEEFERNPPVDNRGNRIQPYYRIEGNKIILMSNALRRCRSICLEFLQKISEL